MKLLIGIPTSVYKNYCFDEFIENVLAMGHDYLIVDNSLTNNPKLKGYKHIYCKHDRNVRQAIVNAQNAIRAQFLKGDWTHLAFLESDLVPPVDTFKKLALYNLPVVGHPYFVMKGGQREYMIHSPVYVEACGVCHAKPTSLEEGFDMCTGNLRRVYSVGFGCILIERSVIEALSFHIKTSDRMQDVGVPSASDSFFASDCLMNGIPIYADTSRTIMHYNRNWN